jgi:hypothetical protein
VHSTTGAARGHVRGTIACRSVWSCPVCSGSIRRDRQASITEAGQRWEEAGGTIWLWTLTLKHDRNDLLRDLLGALYESYGRTTKGNPWEKRLERYGIAHVVRSTEATWGPSAGWHPHFHIALFVKPGYDLTEVAKLGDKSSEHFPTWLEERWIDRLAAVGRSAAKGIGSDVRLIAAEGVAYAIAPEEAKRADKVALELARGDLKTAFGDRCTPFEMLDHPGEIEWEMRFAEWELATEGRKCMAGVRALCVAMGVELNTEKKSTEKDVGDSVEWVEDQTDRLHAEAWKRLCDGRLDHAAVTAYAYGGLVAVHALLGDSSIPGYDVAPGQDPPLEHSDTSKMLPAVRDSLSQRTALDAAATSWMEWQMATGWDGPPSTASFVVSHLVYGCALKIPT